MQAEHEEKKGRITVKPVLSGEVKEPESCELVRNPGVVHLELRTGILVSWTGRVASVATQV